MYSLKKYSLLLIIALTGLFACKKDDYYLDSGLANPYFKGNVVDYLNAKPFYFDTIAAIAKLADMENILKSDTVTFFAPTDYSVQNLIVWCNNSLYNNGYDTIRSLQDVPKEIWRKYLSFYVFHGANQLKDYPQIDYSLLINFPGQTYYSWDMQPMNIGVVYNSDNGVKYVGYRQLSISYIPDISRPTNWMTSMVASCNIITDNGVVHVLNAGHNYFGFDANKFTQDVQAAFASSGK
ncbi:fasciclin domain-containing protein [Chitinophaga sp. RAB17]|uniref:fasciclin domain-containing protein n=1 Tax=Chitinophaga sp. RAB17 TaxID=3233049 RepID=UPI003F9174A9